MGGMIHRNSLKPGYKLHWYEIREILGQGGFGITYLAYDANLDKYVAIKEYLPIELAVREGDFSVHPVSENHGKQYDWGLSRFITEARTLSRFKHPNIVRVLSVSEENNTAYMVMEYEQGQSLQEKLMGKKTLEESELMKILIPILGGLEEIHKTGFIHRDIKPDNIFIRNDGSPVLLDFGSARQALGEQTKTLTSLVTPGYAPFEQYFSKSDEQGPWTDIYGLGATLYRAITGVPPMDAVDRSNAILKTSSDTFVPAVKVGKGKYSERFLKAIDHALCFKQEERPQTIGEWKTEFDLPEDPIQEAIAIERKTTQPGTKVFERRQQKVWPLGKAALLIVFISVVISFYYRDEIQNYFREPAESEHQRTEEEEKELSVLKQQQKNKEELRRIEEKQHQAELNNKLNEEQRLAELDRKHQEEEAQLQLENEIAQLLQEAEEDIKASRYIDPPGQNALERYLMVLALDPGNKNALSGKDQIFRHYLLSTDNLINEQKFIEAESTLMRADAIEPDSIEVRLAQVRLNDARAEVERITLEEEREREEQQKRKEEEQRHLAELEKRRQVEEQKRLEEERRRLEEEKRRQEQVRLVEIERQWQEEEKRKEEAEKKEKYSLLISEAEQALLVKDYSQAKDKYTEALNIYPDNPEIMGKHSHLKIIIENCHSIIGTWIWFTGNTHDLNPDGTVGSSGGDIVGTWECSDPENRQFILRWNAGWIDNLKLSHDGNKLDGKNQWSFPVSAQRNQQSDQIYNPRKEKEQSRLTGLEQKRQEDERKKLELAEEKLRDEKRIEEQYQARKKVIQAIQGEWQSDFGTINIYEISNEQIGGNYSGLFVNDGTIIGSLEGDRLSGYWLQNSAARGCSKKHNGYTYWGHFVFQFQNEYRNYIGKWGYCDEEKTESWNGWKR